jgi:organic hydroperoxide reductase OsmC/OhrA
MAKRTPKLWMNRIRKALIAAAHPGCFTMALAFQLQGAGYTPTELNTEAAVTLEPEV